MEMTVDIHEISPADLFVLPRGYRFKIVKKSIAFALVIHPKNTVKSFLLIVT